MEPPNGTKRDGEAGSLSLRKRLAIPGSIKGLKGRAMALEMR